MAKISRRSGMTRGRVGGDTFKSQSGQQIIYKQTPRSIPYTVGERKRHTTAGKIAKRFGLLPTPIQGLWEVAAGKFSSSPSEVEVKQDTQKSFGGLKITHHIHHYNSAGFYLTCNEWAQEAGLAIPREFPPDYAKEGAYPSPPNIVDWTSSADGAIALSISISQQSLRYLHPMAELAVIVRAAYRGERKSSVVGKASKKKRKVQFLVRDQVVAKAIIPKVPSEIEMKFDKVHLGAMWGDKYIALGKLGIGIMYICANVIGAPNRYMGKSNMYPELKGTWHLLTPKEIEQFSKEGRIKDEPLYDAVKEDDFNGSKLAGALKSIESNYIKLRLGEGEIPKELKKSGEFFRNLNQANSKISN